jgi:hypothetical protein
MGLVTERPRAALRQPRSLTPEQLLDNLVTHPEAPTPVTAWVLWEDGVEEQVTGQAVAWTRRAVRVRFGAPPHLHEVWVWVGAVQRQEEVRRTATGDGDRRAAAAEPRPRATYDASGARAPRDGNDVRR